MSDNAPPLSSSPPTSKSFVYKCHKCSSALRLHPDQVDSILKQQQQQQQQQKQPDTSNSNLQAQAQSQDAKAEPQQPSSAGIPSTANIADTAVDTDAVDVPSTMQCVYVKCPTRSHLLLECYECSDLSLCRNCCMPLCHVCRPDLKVLQCGYCNAFICSQQCYSSLLEKYFECLQCYGLSTKSHQSMHFLRKLLLAPHLHAALAHISDDDLPFHICEGCKVQNCGCVDWLACVNCRKYYCGDCEETALQKCKLEQCRSRTCCHKQEWDHACQYCNQLKRCQLIFCTQGHCDRHIIINQEMHQNDDN
mmetsp:Transcript_45437/g.75442  ORF Transcript_45437/g.75442 Transcript_45437/m.75442 type:complete len:306 (-) Transcript_45437:79-996(-)